MKTAIIFLIKLYQILFSPRRGALRFVYQSALFSLNPMAAPGCRQTPSCSDYCLDVVRRFGCLKGLRLTFVRVINCQ